MKIFDEGKREFLSKFFADVCKTIFAVGLASKLFVDLKSAMRISLLIGLLITFLLAYFLQPPKEGAKK